MEGWTLGNTPENTGEYWVVIPDRLSRGDPKLVLTWYYKSGKVFWLEGNLNNGRVPTDQIVAYKPADIPDIPDEVWDAVERATSTKLKEETL